MYKRAPKAAEAHQAAASPKRNLKKHRFCRQDDIKFLRDLLFSRNQPLKSADDYYIEALKSEISLGSLK
jgi:hypothetical protein